MQPRRVQPHGGAVSYDFEDVVSPLDRSEAIREERNAIAAYAHTLGHPRLAVDIAAGVHHGALRPEDPAEAAAARMVPSVPSVADVLAMARTTDPADDAATLLDALRSWPHGAALVTLRAALLAAQAEGARQARENYRARMARALL